MRQRLERLMIPGRRCARAAIRSLRLQRVAAQWYVAGLRVAIAITSRRSEGGKAPRSTRARRILQATEALRKIATSPTTHGMAVTLQRVGHLQIRRVVRRRSPQDDLTTEGQGQRGGMGAYHRLQHGLVNMRQGDRESKWHAHGTAPDY